MQRYATLAVLLGLASCSQNCPTKVSRPIESERLATIHLAGGAEVMIAPRSTGGGAGDKTYNVLGCSKSGKLCDVLGNVDSYEDKPPELIAENNGYTLLVNKRDSIHGFMNFSEEIQSLSRGSVTLRYRS